MPLKLILLYLILVLPHSNYIKYSCLILWISFSFRVEIQWYRKQTRAASENCWRHHVTNSITPDLAGWSNLLTMVKTPKLFICGKQLEHHGKNMTVCLHHKQVLGNVFGWHATKSCGILKIHRWKFQGSKRITLDMVQQLKVKNFDIQPGHMLCRQYITAYENIINASSSDTEVEETPMDDSDEGTLDECT